MRELSLHILDILTNSTRAGASLVTLRINMISKEDRLVISFIDNGCGMSEEFVQKVTDPFATTRSTRKVGLGLPLLKELLNEPHSLHNMALFHIPKVFPLNHSLSLVFLLGAYSLSKPGPNQNPKNLIKPLIRSLELLRGFPLSPRKRPPI